MIYLIIRDDHKFLIVIIKNMEHNQVQVEDLHCTKQSSGQHLAYTRTLLLNILRTRVRTYLTHVHVRRLPSSVCTIVVQFFVLHNCFKRRNLTT